MSEYKEAFNKMFGDMDDELNKLEQSAKKFKEAVEKRGDQ